MPTAAPRPCQRPCCPSYAADGSGYCATHRPIERARQQRADNASRPNSNAQGYNYRWRKARLTFLARNPVCKGWGDTRGTCMKPATELDHIVPHKGDQALFWETTNWQGLCLACHSSKTATEDGGFGNATNARTCISH